MTAKLICLVRGSAKPQLCPQLSYYFALLNTTGIQEFSLQPNTREHKVYHDKVNRNKVSEIPINYTVIWGKVENNFS